jgi:hypothetical protein
LKNRTGRRTGINDRLPHYHLVKMIEVLFLKTEYLLIHKEQSSAEITFGNRLTAELRKLDNERYTLSHQNQGWILNKKVDGQVRPFSVVASKSTGDDLMEAEEVLKIKDHIFTQNGFFYMLGGMPEGRIPKHHLMGSKYICRLTNFPFSHHDQIDAETRNRLKKYRGVPVGEFYGLGSNGFHMKLDEELNETGLPLAASTYLIYSSI